MSDFVSKFRRKDSCLALLQVNKEGPHESSGRHENEWIADHMEKGVLQ